MRMSHTVRKDVLEQYVVSGNDAVEFRLVHTPDDLDKEEGTFNPEMCHQIFGEGESIFGYKDLVIQLYFGAATLETYLGMKYGEKISPEKADQVEADDVIEVISQKLPENDFHTNLDVFTSKLQQERNFRPAGDLQRQWKVTADENPDGEEVTYEIYHNIVASPKYRKYHMRMESFVMWFVDGAQFIDVDDENWNAFVLYEKRRDGDDTWYTFCGYCSVYKYWAYPDKQRPRVSQILILPPFQRRGLAAQLLQTVFTFYVGRADVVDITFEDPSEDLARVRDYIDAKNCQRLSAFHPAKLMKGFSDEMRTEAREKLKIGKRQARRVYEILRLKNTPKKSAAEYKKYRLDVKNRLNATARQEQLNLEKARKAFKKESASYAELHASLENRIEKLDAEFKELEAEYLKVIERLDRD